MIPQYIYIFIFVVIAYIIVTDNNVSYAFGLSIRIVKFWIEKTKWWMLHNPSNPIVKYMIWRRSLKIAKELERELNDKSK
jgi:hypothetical protein